MPLEGVKVTVDGDIDLHGFFGFSETRPGFGDVRVSVKLSGLGLFRNPTPVKTSLA